MLLLLLVPPLFFRRGVLPPCSPLPVARVSCFLTRCSPLLCSTRYHPFPSSPSVFCVQASETMAGGRTSALKKLESSVPRQGEFRLQFFVCMYIALFSACFLKAGLLRFLCGALSVSVAQRLLCCTCNSSDPMNTEPFFLFAEVFHRITESQNGRGWRGPLWVI